MKSAIKRLLIVPNALFIVLLLIQLLPSQETRIPDQPIYTVIFTLILELILLIGSFTYKQDQSRQVFTDIIGFLYCVLIIWVLTAAKMNLVGGIKGAIYPPPGAVFMQFIIDFKIMLVNVRDSLTLVLQGYLIGIAIAIPLGLFLGWNFRIGATASYIAKFLSSISPIVYIPYAIVLLPTFRAASVFVIIVATFWPTLASTMSGVLNMEKKIVDSARALGLSNLTMLFRVILPGSLPQIFIGCNQGLSVSFILLLSAEMIGARSGMGYYVNNYANFGNFTAALAGVIVIGIVVTAITFLFNQIQSFLLKWK